MTLKKKNHSVLPETIYPRQGCGYPESPKIILIHVVSIIQRDKLQTVDIFPGLTRTERAMRTQLQTCTKYNITCVLRINR